MLLVVACNVHAMTPLEVVLIVQCILAVMGKCFFQFNILINIELLWFQQNLSLIYAEFVMEMEHPALV